jgi:hypothetical protein
MKRLNIDFNDIQKAMEDVSRDKFEYYLDIETGEVIALSEEILGKIESRLYDSDYEEIENDIEYIEYDEEPDLPEWMEDEVELVMEVLLDEDRRYVHIPEREPQKAYKTMAEFIDTVENLILKEELSQALNGKGAFRKFKDVLIRYPKERKRWHGYNAKAVKNEIIDWMNTLGRSPVS